LKGLCKWTFFPTPLIPHFLMCTYLNHLEFNFFCLHQILIDNVYLFTCLILILEVMRSDEDAITHDKIMHYYFLTYYIYLTYLPSKLIRKEQCKILI